MKPRILLFILILFGAGSQGAVYAQAQSRIVFAQRSLPSEVKVYLWGKSIKSTLTIQVEGSYPRLIVREFLPLGWKMTDQKPIPYDCSEGQGEDCDGTEGDFRWVFFDVRDTLITVQYSLRIPYGKVETGRSKPLDGQVIYIGGSEEIGGVTSIPITKEPRPIWVVVAVLIAIFSYSFYRSIKIVVDQRFELIKGKAVPLDGKVVYLFGFKKDIKSIRHISYKSSNEEIVTVTETGEVEGKSEGKAEVTIMLRVLRWIPTSRGVEVSIAPFLTSYEVSLKPKIDTVSIGARDQGTVDIKLTHREFEVFQMLGQRLIEDGRAGTAYDQQGWVSQSEPAIVNWNVTGIVFDIRKKLKAQGIVDKLIESAPPGVGSYRLSTLPSRVHL